MDKQVVLSFKDWEISHCMMVIVSIIEKVLFSDKLFLVFTLCLLYFNPTSGKYKFIVETFILSVLLILQKLKYRQRTSSFVQLGLGKNLSGSILSIIYMWRLLGITLD